MKLIFVCHFYCLCSLFFLSLGSCSFSSSEFARGSYGWRERTTGTPKLLSPVPSTGKTVVNGTNTWRSRPTGTPRLISPIANESKITVYRNATSWRDRPTGTPELFYPRTAKLDDDKPVVEIEQVKRIGGTSNRPVLTDDSTTLPKLQATWSKLSPEELVDQLEKGLHKEEVKAILSSASVVEVVNSWGKLWVMGSDSPPVFFDERGRLIDWGWFDYHNLAADLDMPGDSGNLPIRIVKQLTLDDIMPLPSADSAF